MNAYGPTNYGIPTSDLERLIVAYLLNHRWTWSSEEEAFEHPEEAGVFSAMQAAAWQIRREKSGTL